MDKSTRGADSIISSISTQISNGKLKSGDRLPAEAKLCKQYAVSRTVVREAIQQLKALGVIHTITGSGSYITDGDLNGLKNSLELFSIMTGDTQNWIELLELRILLESSSARNLAGENYSKKGLQALKTVIKDMSESKEDLERFSDLDLIFHQTLIKATGNQIIKAVLSSLENIQRKFAKETYRVGNKAQLIEANFNEHKAIVDAIEKRDPETAEIAMREHLENTMKNLHLFIKKQKDNLR